MQPIYGLPSSTVALITSGLWRGYRSTGAGTGRNRITAMLVAAARGITQIWTAHVDSDANIMALITSDCALNGPHHLELGAFAERVEAKRRGDAAAVSAITIRPANMDCPPAMMAVIASGCAPFANMDYRPT